MKKYTKSRKGQILIIVNALMAVLLVYSLALVNLALGARKTEKTLDLKIVSQNIAEAGIAKALWCLNQTEGSNCGGTFGSGFTGEGDVSFGNGLYDTTMTTVDTGTKIITATGYFPNKTATISKSIVKITAITDSDKASFTYGLQVGQGGLKMKSNVTINGSVYAHGTIDGENNSLITGDAYVAGGTALTPDQSYNTYNNDFTFGKSNPEVDIAQSFVPGATDVLNKVSLYIKKVGSPSNIKVRIVEDDGGVPKDEDIEHATLNTSIVSTNYGWIEVAFSSPPLLTAGNTYWIVLDSARDHHKYWKIGVDSFDGYANGTMLYSKDWDKDPWISSGNDINFKTWLGGTITGIKDATVNGSVYAHYATNVTVLGDAEVYDITDSAISGDVLANSITNSSIGKNATTTDINSSSVDRSLWCSTQTSTTVGWLTFCPTSLTPPTDPGPVNNPISDIMISDWKTDAENGGIIEGDYTLSDDETLGPVKINGNLTITNGNDLTIAGTIYVTGNIIASNNVIIQLASSYGSSSGILMADGNIRIENNVDILGADPGSNVMIVSLIESLIDKAIELNNNVNAGLFYTPNGIMQLEDNATVKQITAYELELENNVTLNYEVGLSEINFSSGPSGGWTELKGSWVLVE